MGKGNFFEIIEEMQEGDVVTNTKSAFPYYIKKVFGSGGCYMYIDKDTGEIAKGLGVNGFVIAFDAMNKYEWEYYVLNEGYTEIDIEEALKRIRVGKPVYADNKKMKIDLFTEMEELNIHDFQDLLSLTSYFK